MKFLQKPSRDISLNELYLPHQNVQQEALKRLANSMYGVYGFIRFRWYCLECADSITAWGRDFIKKTMKKSEEAGFKPLYADTDGFYATYTE